MVFIEKIIPALLVTIVSATGVLSNEENNLLVLKEYGFSIRTPKEWRTKTIDLGYKCLTLISKNVDTEISISSMRQNPDEIEKWENWEEWYKEGKGYAIKRIVETKTLLLDQNTVGRLLLFEYHYKESLMLQRVLIARYDDTLIVIECKAPLGVYAHYHSTFTDVMGSFRRIEK